PPPIENVHQAVQGAIEKAHSADTVLTPTDPRETTEPLLGNDDDAPNDLTGDPPDNELRARSSGSVGDLAVDRMSLRLGMSRRIGVPPMLRIQPTMPINSF